METYAFNNIIISGLPGSGKSTLTSELEKKTGWKLHYIGGIFRKAYAELPDSEKKDLSFENWWSSLPDSEQIRVNREIRELALKGKIIGDTRYAKICENTNSLFVFLTADLGIRALRALGSQKYQGKSLEEIQEILTNREADEVRIGKEQFKFDYRNSEDYNLIIDTGKMSIDDEVRAVISALGKNAP